VVLGQPGGEGSVLRRSLGSRGGDAEQCGVTGEPDGQGRQQDRDAPDPESESAHRAAEHPARQGRAKGHHRPDLVRIVDVEGHDKGEVRRDVHHDGEQEEVGDQVARPRAARRDEQPPDGEDDGGDDHRHPHQVQARKDDVPGAGHS
jgi:hypothetical protein